MPALKYATAEGGLISVVLPSPGEDHDAVMAAVVPQDGISVLVVSEADYTQAAGEPGHSALQALVNAHTGKVPPDPRQAVVDADGNVVDVILAYPSVYTAPRGHSLVPSRVAEKGDKYAAGERKDDNIERVIADRAKAEIDALTVEADLGS